MIHSASRLFDVPTEGYLGSRIDQNYAPADIHVNDEALLNRVWHKSWVRSGKIRTLHWTLTCKKNFL